MANCTVRYVVELTKIIVVEVEDMNDPRLTDPSESWDGAWDRATPNSECLSEENE